MDLETLPYQYEGQIMAERHGEKLKRMFGRRISDDELARSWNYSLLYNDGNPLITELEKRSRNRRQLFEWTQSFGQMSESLLNIPYPACISYGIAMPTYDRFIREYQAVHGGTTHRSLLVGALTQETVREYATLMHAFVLNPDPVIIDIEGIETVEAAAGIADFRFADALAPDLSRHIGQDFDSIHTNLITNGFYGLNPSPEYRKQFLFNMHSLLKPGGRLIMVETDFSDDPRNYIRRLHAEALQIGFRHVHSGQAIRFKTRRILERHMLSTHAKINDNDICKEDLFQAVVVEK